MGKAEIILRNTRFLCGGRLNNPERSPSVQWSRPPRPARIKGSVRINEKTVPLDKALRYSRYVFGHDGTWCRFYVDPANILHVLFSRALTDFELCHTDAVGDGLVKVIARMHSFALAAPCALRFGNKTASVFTSRF